MDGGVCIGFLSGGYGGRCRISFWIEKEEEEEEEKEAVEMHIHIYFWRAHRPLATSLIKLIVG
jgi:proteasome lid subunit RPN8/RPN11